MKERLILNLSEVQQTTASPAILIEPSAEQPPDALAADVVLTEVSEEDAAFLLRMIANALDTENEQGEGDSNDR